MSPPTHLEFRDLRRSFGDLRVLDGVSGRVEAGDALLVTGSNGSGKSTLLRCLAGLLAIGGGEVEYVEEGQSLDLIARRGRAAYVAPDLAFYDELTTLENLEFFARLRRVPAERAGELLARVGLPADRPAAALSSGMTQRLRFCFAWLGEPRLLLLDEPLQNLDEPGVALVRELLAEHLAAGGVAVVANPSGLELPGVAEHVRLAG